MHNKNTAQESSDKTITDSHQQPFEDTDNTMEDTTNKMPPLDMLMNQTLMIKIKKIKEGTKSRPKKMQLRAKKFVKSQLKKKEDVKKSPKPPVQIAQLLVTKYKYEHKSLKKKQHVQKSAIVPVKGPKSVQSVPKLAEGDTKHRKDLSIKNVTIRVTELPGDLCKWLVDRFDPYSVTLYISLDKRIEITQMDVHITLALPIGGKKLEEFYKKKPENATYNEVLDAWRKDWNLQDGTPKLSQMPQYILSQTDAGEKCDKYYLQ
ncbi:hypothetical protein Cgig2_028765 [Carnegiea gigantea]|uniref:Uncharacterized protein n=1 Tax=Carnegiea gigantea TaxID=171969 RepID=A0A9Q1Q477_9CARY|nr:hypothetical protein Cgig2_028765 [Carnegiea gigantea]